MTGNLERNAFCTATKLLALLHPKNNKYVALSLAELFLYFAIGRSCEQFVHNTGYFFVFQGRPMSKKPWFHSCLIFEVVILVILIQRNTYRMSQKNANLICTNINLSWTTKGFWALVCEIIDFIASVLTLHKALCSDCHSIAYKLDDLDEAKSPPKTK